MARAYQQGIFKPMHPEKYSGDVNNIIFRSSWERKFLGWCDRNPSVVMYSSEELIIPYFCRLDEKMHRYFVDFVVKFRTSDGNLKTVIIEIKPYKETIEPVRGRKREETWRQEVETWIKNQDKWVAAEAFAKKNNLEFIIMTENELGLAKGKSGGLL